MYEIMLTTDMLSYYRIFPKAVFEDFAIFFIPPDFAEELKIELEAILGMTLKFETISEEKIVDLILNNREAELVLKESRI